MTARTLIAYYSMTGNTQKLADEIRTQLGPEVDVEPIRETRPRGGFTGVLRALVDTLARREPALVPPGHDPAQYELLVLGGPVWGGRMAAPVRSFAHRYGAAAPQVAFFCTEGGRGADTAFADLAQFCAHAPRATLCVDAEHRAPDRHCDALARFAAQARLAPA